MKNSLLVSLLAIAVSSVAWAGTPLKGVNVALGKNPGGTPVGAARMTDANGKVPLGVLTKGSYTLTIAEPAPDAASRDKLKGTTKTQGDFNLANKRTCLVSIEGIATTPYKVEWDFELKRPSPVQPAQSSLKAMPPGPNADKITFNADGVHPVTVTVDQ